LSAGPSYRPNQRKMADDYFLWRGGYENKHKFYTNSRDPRWKIASSIKHPKTLTDAEPEAIILFNSFPKRPPAVESMPISCDWRSMRPPYRSELRRLARTGQYDSENRKPEVSDAFSSDLPSRSEMPQSIDFLSLLGQLRRSHAELLRAIEAFNARSQNGRRPSSSRSRADAAALAADISRLQAVRDQLEAQVRAARAALR
jgi:hypothetical protein